MCICHIVSEYKNNLFLPQIKVLFENSMHLSHSFRIESGSRLGTASTAAPPCGAYLPLHSIPGRGPGLTENGSALRTTPPHSRSSASPKRIGMDIRHTPTHSPLTLRVSGVTENSAFPTRLRLTLALSHASASLPHIATPATGASEMRYSLETPSVRSAAEDAWGYCRHTLSRRFGDALLLQRRSLTARAVTSSVNPRQRRGTSARH